MEDLDKRYKKGGFRVPEGYFEGFDEKVLERIRSGQTSPPVFVSVWRKSRTWMVAASMAAILSIGYIAFRTAPVDTPDKISFDDLDSSELLAFEEEVELSEEEFEEIIPAYTIDSLYQAEIIPASYQDLNPEELRDLEEEFSALDEDITEI